MIVLSKRLQAVASMVTPGKRPADVGCDHGYVPIYLVQSGYCTDGAGNGMLMKALCPGPEKILKNTACPAR